MAVHYFAGRAGALVPNNSALTARLFAELATLEGADPATGQAATATGRVDPAAGGIDPGARRLAARLVRFVGDCQLPTGELPYAVALPPSTGGDRPHFQCYQYNAFQLLDLLRCHDLIGLPDPRECLAPLAAFVRGGLDRDHSSYFDCRHGPRRVVYHTAAIAAALEEADRHQLVDAAGRDAAAGAYRAVLAAQRADGSLPFSRGDYGVARDDRAYPRNLAMILVHLLARAGRREPPR